MFRKLLLAAVVALVTIQPGLPVMAQTRTVTITPQPSVQATRTLAVPLNKSQVLRVSQPVTRVTVGNADIADVQPLSDHSFYVLGKAIGTTNVTVYGENGELLAVVDVLIGGDLEGVKAALHANMPGTAIDVRAVNDTIALGGVVDSPAKIAQAVEIAKHFVDKDKAVINNLRLKGTQQVMLQVKIAEMQRSVSKDLGFKPFLSAGKTTSTTNPTGFSLSTLDPVNLSNFALAAGRAVAGNFTFALAIDALEERGAVKILAEPNLVAMSGDTANFLAGGEFPVPVSQNTSAGVPTVTVEFKPFGVSLAFTPTVIDGELINLVVAPEVSQLDKTNAVTFSGFTIPGISTRRAKTTVELRDGQSFAIAGLLSSDFTDDMRGLPGVMDVPVLGALFRSSQYQRNETELVVIVTPKLVQPVAAGSLAAPTDTFVPPSDTQFFLNGKTENPDSSLTSRMNGGGLTGQYGYILR
jgi:pilus assembly protein CpaC